MSNILLISLDCVRPEALSCFPSSFDYLLTAPYRAKTPNIDSVAEHGITFTNAFTQAPFTPASHASVFTGTNPYRHGIRSMFGCELREDLTTMAEAYRDAGYETGGFVGAHALSSDYGLDRGFDTFDEEFDEAHENWIVGNRRPGDEVTSKALEWMDETKNEFFLFVHYFDAHDGGEQQSNSVTGDEALDVTDGTDEIATHVRLYNRYLRSLDRRTGRFGERLFKSYQDFRDDSRSGRRYHLEQVQKVDDELGRILQQLKDSGRYDETVIVIFADHGDAFGEHGEFGHRDYLYDTTLRVPLIVKPAEVENDFPKTVENPVRLIDVLPTVGSLTNTEVGQSEGVNLYGRTEDATDDLRVYAETRSEESPSALDMPKTDYVALRSDSWKLIVDLLRDEEELYDVASDPNENFDLSESCPEIRMRMREELDDILRNTPDKMEDIDTSSADSSIADHLKGLGYI